MLRFEVRPVSLDMLEIQRADHFLAFSLDMLEIQRADLFLAFSFDMLEIQRWDHFLCYVSRSALSYTEGGPFLMLRFEVRPEIIFRTMDGGPFLILRFKIHAF